MFKNCLHSFATAGVNDGDGVEGAVFAVGDSVRIGDSCDKLVQFIEFPGRFDHIKVYSVGDGGVPVGDPVHGFDVGADRRVIVVREDVIAERGLNVSFRSAVHSAGDFILFVGEGVVIEFAGVVARVVGAVENQVDEHGVSPFVSFDFVLPEKSSGTSGGVRLV